MKWLGAALLIIVCSMLGFEYSSRLNKRPEHIRQIKSSLLILEAEIQYSQSKLQDSFKVIASQVPSPTNQLFFNLYHKLYKFHGDLADLWKACIKEYVKTSSLTTFEQEVLVQFGNTLGQYDVNQQGKYISVTINHLDRLLNEAEQKRKKYSNLTKTLGVLLGLFIVLLLF